MISNYEFSKEIFLWVVFTALVVGKACCNQAQTNPFKVNKSCAGKAISRQVQGSLI